VKFNLVYPQQILAMQKQYAHCLILNNNNFIQHISKLLTMATYGFISQHCILVLSIMMGDWPFSKASFAKMLIKTKTL